MKILIVSDSPFGQSAYAIQAYDFAKRAAADGHDVVYFGATYMGRPQVLENGIRLVGSDGEHMGNNMLIPYCQSERPDFVIAFKDPPVYEQGVLANLPVPFASIVPIDTEPISAPVLSVLPYIQFPIAICRHGFEEMHTAGYKSFYNPLSIDTEFFSPGDQAETRERLGWANEPFIALVVAANQAPHPSRKNFERLGAAWASFLLKDRNSEHPQKQNAVLHLHINLKPRVPGMGVDIEPMLEFFKIPRHNWAVSNQTQYLSGLEAEYVRDLYRASDVVLCLGNEGFGVPALEAQACGKPVVGIEFAALRDMIWAGYKIASAHDEYLDDVLWHPGYWSFRYQPRPSRIVEALERAYDNRHNRHIAEQAREGALQYDAEHVWSKYWRPTLRRIEKSIKGSVRLSA